MKKIMALVLSIMVLTVFSITAFAENDDLVGSVPDPSNSSDTTSAGDDNNVSSESGSSSSSGSQTSSENTTSSEDTASSEPENTAKYSLQIISLPNRMTYELGENLDLAGLRVNIVGSSGTVVSNDGKDLTVSPATLKTEGKCRITVEYEDATAYFTVTVNPKHAHKYGAWEITKEATCSKEGSKSRKCEECEYVEKQAIAKLEHDWDEGEIIKTATQKTSGVIRYVCTKCEEKMDETIPILESGNQVNDKTEEKFTLQFQWWMIFIPVGLIIASYIVAIVIIFKKKA